jgi:hypothetical protein
LQLAEGSARNSASVSGTRRRNSRINMILGSDAHKAKKLLILAVCFCCLVRLETWLCTCIRDDVETDVEAVSRYLQMCRM